MKGDEPIGTVTSVTGGTVLSSMTPSAAPGLAFSRGHAYYVGQVGAFARIPIGLIDLYAIVVEVGVSAPTTTSGEPDASPRAWMRLELIGQADRSGAFKRGVARYPTIGDSVRLVTAGDLANLYAGESVGAHVRYGSIANAPHIPAMLDIEKLVTRHGAVFGSTGSGKSTTVAALLHALSDPAEFPSSRVVVLDLHGEYGGALRHRADVFDAEVSSESIRPPDEARTGLFVPYWALPFAEFASVAFGPIDSTSQAIVQDVVTRLKRQYVAANAEEFADQALVVTADTPIPFSVRGLWLELYEEQFATHTVNASAQTADTRAYELDANGDEMRGDAERAVAPTYVPATQAAGASKVFLSSPKLGIPRQIELLGRRLRDPLFDFLFRPGPWDVPVNGAPASTLADYLKTWLGSTKPIVIADLSAVPSSVIDGVVAALIRVLLDASTWARKLSEGTRERPLLLVLEEAHRYLGDSGGQASAVVSRIAKEGRKFGVGLLLVSQRPSEIPANVLSQIGSFMVMRLTNSSDRALVRASLPDTLGEMFEHVPVLRTGELIATGEAFTMPARVLVDAPFSIRPESFDPRVFQPGPLPGGWNSARVPEDYSAVVRAWRLLRATVLAIAVKPGTKSKGKQKMERTPVASSNLASVGYDEPSSTLEVEFIGGRVYQYYGVPVSVYHDFMAAPSKGAFHARAIKNVYRYAQL